jgi:hypothetical protein
MDRAQNQAKISSALSAARMTAATAVGAARYQASAASQATRGAAWRSSSVVTRPPRA